MINIFIEITLYVNAEVCLTQFNLPGMIEIKNQEWIFKTWNPFFSTLTLIPTFTLHQYRVTVITK